MSITVNLEVSIALRCCYSQVWDMLNLCLEFEAMGALAVVLVVFLGFMDKIISTILSFKGCAYLVKINVHTKNILEIWDPNFLIPKDNRKITGLLQNCYMCGDHQA